MRVQRFDAVRLPELMRWFPDADACRVWGGPSFRVPCTPETFRADTYSLFVLPGNERATRLYQRPGFAPARYPERDPMFDDRHYRVAESLRS